MLVRRSGDIPRLPGAHGPGLAPPVKRLAAALALVTLIRLIVAATAPLAPDETYYWVWSHALAPGYVDHPPMVALWIRTGTILAGQSALGVRLLGPLAAALASWMLFDAARVLFPGTAAGVAAVMLLNATLLLGVGTVIMTPDSPLLFFWTATLWAMARVAAGGPGVWWLAAGLFGGLALDSKYTALLLWIGIGLWVLLVPAVRPWLRRWQPWAACLIGLSLFAPVLAWNATHRWAGLVRQGGRVEDWRPARAAGFLAELVGGQIGLATPLIWVLCMMALAIAARRSWGSREVGWSLLTALSLPPVLVFVQHAFGDRVQGNWPAIIYPALAIAAGGLALPKRWWIGACALGFAITALAYIQATAGMLPLPPRIDPIAIRLAGWDGLARQLETLRETGHAGYVAADGYALASELAWWMPAAAPVVGTDARWQLTTLTMAPIAGKPGLLIRDAGRADPPDPTAWTDVERVGSLARPGIPGAGFTVYRVTAANIAPYAATLPGRQQRAIAGPR
jgi:4-amino-4-deoxy-L-arabinose transferase-like glycosyltransferase